MKVASRKVPRPLAIGAFAAFSLAGCASNLSGVGGAEHYACQAPVGAQCTSMSGVYANALAASKGTSPAHALPAETAKAPRTDASPPAPQTPQRLVLAPAASPPETLRSAPRVLRLWIAPWEDSDGDLHEAASVHVLIDQGRWLIERVRPSPRALPLGVSAPRPSAPMPAPAEASEPEAQTLLPTPRRTSTPASLETGER